MGAAPKPKPNVVPMRTLNDKEALAWLVQRGRVETSVAALARDWRWNSKKVKSSLDRWSSAGDIDVKPGLGGKTVVTVVSATPASDGALAGSGPTLVPTVGAVPMATNAPATAVLAPARSETAPAAVQVAPADPAPDAPQATPAAATPQPPIFAVQPRAPAPVPVSALEPPATEPVALLSKIRPAAMRASAPAAVVIAAPAMAAPAVVQHPRGSGFVNALAYLIAVALAGIAAFFSISGMIVLFPGAPAAIVTMGIVMETAKLVTVAFLAHQWRTLAWLSRIVLVILVAGLAAINAAGVYSQLVAAHFGDRVTAESDAATKAAALAAETEVQIQTVADFDRRLSQIDGAIAEMTKRGRASGALEAISAQRKQREALVAQRRQEAEKLVAFKSEAAAVMAQNHKIEVEAAPIMYVAQMIGTSTEQAIRLLILLMVLTCDPLAVALTAAASRPRWRK